MIQATETIAQRELRLIVEAQAGSEAAFAELIEMHHRFVWKEALKVKRYGIEIEDIVQIGLAQLAMSIRNFDPSRGYRLLTFAGWGIKREMWRAAQRTRKDRVGGTIDLQELVIFPSNCESPAVVAQRREDVESLREAMKLLPDRLRGVVLARMSGETLEQIGNRMNIGRERVRQLEAVAFDRLRNHLVGDVA